MKNKFLPFLSFLFFLVGCSFRSDEKKHDLILDAVRSDDISVFTHQTSKLSESDLLKIKSDGLNVLHIAIDNCSLDSISYIIDNYPGFLNVKDDYFKQTPLISAVVSQCVPAVKLFLEKGADINLKDGKGETAMEVARLVNNSEVIAILERHIRKTGQSTKR